MVPCFSGLPRRSYRVFGAGILVALSLTLAACGGTDAPPAATPTEPPAAWALQPVSDAVLVERLRTALNPGNSAKSVAESAVLVSVPSSDALGGVPVHPPPKSFAESSFETTAQGGRLKT